VRSGERRLRVNAPRATEPVAAGRVAEAPAPGSEAAGASASWKPSTLRTVGLAISAISLAAVVVWATQQPAPELPSSPAELAALAAAVLAYAGATALRGERWWRVMRRDGARPSRSDAYALTVVGYMGNNVLPARGGDAIRVVLAAPRALTTMRKVIGTLVAERLLDAVTLLGLFAILAYGVLRGIEAPSGLAVSAGVAVVALVVAVILLARAGDRGGGGRLARVAAFLAPLATATMQLRGRYGATMLAWTVAIWTLEAATYLAVAGAAEVEMTPIEALYVVALASVFVLIPSGPGYLGTLDAAVLFGIGAIGGTGAEALSYLILLRAVLLLPITVAGLAILLARYGGFSSEVRAEARGR
jgi:glycosyltransferase 2 family protein